jgi:hypothetical protein
MNKNIIHVLRSRTLEENFPVKEWALLSGFVQRNDDLHQVSWMSSHIQQLRFGWYQVLCVGFLIKKIYSENP